MSHQQAIDLPPLPDQFAEYVARNYSGEVVFSDPRWHAERLWRAAILADRSRSAAPQPLATPAEPVVAAPVALLDELKCYVNDLANWREDDSESLHEAAWQSALMTIDRLAAAAPTLAAAPLGVADRLDAMADAAPTGSLEQSDLYAAATVWRKHLCGGQ